MKELEQIARVWEQAAEAGESGVLATVFEVHGSSYRRPGARLLLTSGGRRAGSISGGCLEADLMRKAWWLTANGPATQRYDTTSNGDVAEEFGLGCNGVIHLFLERLEHMGLPPFGLAEQVRQTRRTAGIATVIRASGDSVRAGQRYLLTPAGEARTDITNPMLKEHVRHGLGRAVQEGIAFLSDWSEAESQAEIFFEAVPPPIRLLAMGAGDDAMPLAQMASLLGWDVLVLDGRSQLARAERFPGAAQVLVNSESDPLVGIEPDERTVAVLMSHSYAQDLAALCALEAKPPRYVGLLGPRKRTERMLAESGLRSAAVMDLLHSPMGLDIGAEGAEQIALAVTAEIHAVMNRREGGKLREKAGVLHARAENETDDEEFLAGRAACPIGT